jgi:hypothetical protein
MSVNVRRVRVELFGQDRVPKTVDLSHLNGMKDRVFMMLYDRMGKEIGKAWVVVRPQEGRCKHRLYVLALNRIVPIGRLTQTREWKALTC